MRHWTRTGDAIHVEVMFRSFLLVHEDASFLLQRRHHLCRMPKGGLGRGLRGNGVAIWVGLLARVQRRPASNNGTDVGITIRRFLSQTLISLRGLQRRLRRRPLLDHDDVTALRRRGKSDRASSAASSSANPPLTSTKPPSASPLPPPQGDPWSQYARFPTLARHEAILPSGSAFPSLRPNLD